MRQTTLPPSVPETSSLTSVLAHGRFPGRSVLSVSEVAAALEVTERHIIDLIDEGRLAGINISASGSGRKHWRIPVSAYDAFINANKSI